MTTNFFKSIAELNIAADMILVISPMTDGSLLVSVRLANEKCGDKAQHRIAPFTLSGSAAELDEAFFIQCSEPLKTADGLINNMESYLKSVEQAKAHSQMEKDKEAKAEKEKNEKQKKYKEAMKKADELDTEGKYRDAWMKVPDPNDYPDNREEITKRKTELSKKFAPDLFH